MCNKKVKKSFFIFILLFIHISNHFVKSQDEPLTRYLQKYQVSEPEIFLLSVNIFDCRTCNSLITLIDKTISQKNKRVIYLMKNIRKIEAEYYLKNELKINPSANEIIIDEEFFNSVNSTSYSYLTLVKNYKPVKNIKLTQALEWLHTKNPCLNILDSITIVLDESNFLLSDRISSFQIIKDSLVFVSDYLYNYLSIYNLKNGNKIRSFDDSKVLKKYSEIFLKYISQDSIKYDYLKNNHALIEKNNFKLGETKSFFVNNENIYLIYQIYFVEPIDTSNFDQYFPDSPDMKAEFLINPVPIPSIAPYLFLIKTDFEFNIKNFYFLGFQHNRYLVDYLISTNNFYTEDNKYVYLGIVNMYKQVKNSTFTNKNIPNKDSLYFIGKFEITDNTINFYKFFNYTMPMLYKEKELYLNNIPDIRFFKNNNNLLAYINILPNLYDLTNDTVYYLGYDSLTKNFSKNKFLLEEQQRISIAKPEISIMIDFIVQSDDMLLVLFSVKDKFYIGLYNKKLENVFSKEINHGLKLINGTYADNRHIYFLGLKDEQKVIVKFSYNIN